MANKTPLTARLSMSLMTVQMIVRREFQSDGRITDGERDALTHLAQATLDAEAVDNARIEAIYALNFGLEEPPSAWHARKRRELEQLKASAPTAATDEAD